MASIQSANLDNLKKMIFYELLNMAGRVFIVVGFTEEVIIGNRGFLPDEKEKGLVLVINSRMNFTWDEVGININLVFGTSPQKCFIPANSIIAVYSPELEAQFSVSFRPRTSQREPDQSGALKPGTVDEKVISVDFKKKKK